jgi:hypothetical protein
VNLSRRSRNLLLWGALAATAIATFFAPSPDTSVQPVRLRPAGNHHPDNTGNSSVLTHKSAENVSRLMPAKRSGMQNEPGELFTVDRPPVPPKTAASRPATPERPVAPPLPYIYMGKMLENGELTLFLTRNEKPYVARAGDILDGQYQVDAIRSTQVELTYLPLGQKQTLNIGANK